jgi:hypothetical protein
MQKVFLSYSRKDMDFARSLAEDLKKAGFEVWWDISTLKSGDDWVREIPAAIEASQAFVLLLSPDSLVSEWVKKEYLHALNLRKKILPVMVRPCQVPFALANINYLDFNPADPTTSFNKLLASLEYQGEPVRETRLAKELSLPPALARWRSALLGLIALGILLLAFLAFRSCAPAPAASTATPTQPPTSTFTAAPGATDTPTLTLPLTSTPSPTATGTASVVITPSDTPMPESTLTPTATREAILRVEFCVRTDFTTLVRTGPGKSYGYLPNPLKGDDCLLFSARNEENSWFMIAPRQPDARFREFEYGWVSNYTLDLESVGAFSLPVGTPLPTATRTPLPTLTATLTPTWTLTASLTPLPTETHTPIPTDTRVPTSTATETPTLEATATP